VLFAFLVTSLLAAVSFTAAQQAPPDQVELEQTARRLFADDQLEAAGRLYEELAARSTTTEDRGRSLCLAAWIAWLAGDEPRVAVLLGRLAREAVGYEPDTSQFDPEFLARLRSAREVESSGVANRASAKVDEASALLRGGDESGAARLLEEALEIDPSYRLALFYSARLASRGGDSARALSLLDQLERLVADPTRPSGRPSLADVLAERGLVHYRAGNFPDAAAALERSANLAPDQPTTWTNLALARERSGDLEGAEAALERVIELGHGDASTWRSLASLASHRGDWAAARERLGHAVEQASPSELPALLLETSQAESRLGLVEEARTHLERAASLLIGSAGAAASDPAMLAAVRRELAFVLLEQGNAAAALVEAEAAALAAPGDADAELARGRALVELGRASEAVAAFERARAIAPNRADLANGLGRALMLAGDPSRAIAAFEDALRLDPSLEVARENRAAASAAASGGARASVVASAPSIFPGLVLRDATWPSGGRRAAEIVSVDERGAAALAGLRAGDLVLRIDGAGITSAAALDATLRQARDRATRLDLVRGDATFSVMLRP
jgi:tetratricopeptide (TPR) repeat protein